MSKRWAFDEPGVYGGNAQNVLTEEEIITFQMNRTDVNYTNRKEALDDFIVVNLCYGYDNWLQKQTANFNKLSASETERLAILVEEMGEAHQAIGKILRHGYESTHPDGGPTNRESLEHELGDVRHSMIRLCNSKDLSKAQIHWFADKKEETINPYLHHQE